MRRNCRLSSSLTILSLLSLVASTANALAFTTSLKTCQEECETRNLAFPLARGELTWATENFTACGYQCRISSCQHGCKDFEQPHSTCDVRCIEEHINEASCRQGCHSVEAAFFQQTQNIINNVTVAIEVMDEGLKLRWEFPEAVLGEMVLQEIAGSEVSWFTQTQSTTGNLGWTWFPLSDGSFRNSTFQSELVIPFESTNSILVRLVLVFRGTAIVSRAVTYQMPSKALKVQLEFAQRIQLTHDKMAFCWTSSNRQTSFKVVLTSLDGNALSTESTNSRCHLLRSLPRENCCRVSVQEVNSEGTSVGEISTQIEMNHEEGEADLGESEEHLVFSNGTNVFQWKNMHEHVVTEEQLLIPTSVPEGETISSLRGISSDRFVFGTTHGAMITVQMDSNATEIGATQIELRNSTEGGAPIIHLDYDSVQNCVYGVIQDTGVVRCFFDGKCTFLAHSDLLNPILQVAVDGWTGYLYFVGSDHNVYKATLFPFEPLSTYHFEKITLISDISPATSIFLDQPNFQLLVTLSNGSLSSYNVVADSYSLLKSADFASISHVRPLSDRFLWSKEKCGDGASEEKCLFGEEMDAATSTLTPMRFTYTGQFVAWDLLKDPPMLKYTLGPEKVGFVSSNSKAKITWLPPTLMPFHAPTTAFRNLSYTVKFGAFGQPPTFSNETFATNMTVTISPGVDVVASVEACFSNICSKPTSTEGDTFPAFTVTPFYFIRRNGENVAYFDLIGDELTEKPVTGLQSIPDTVFAYDNSTQTTYLRAANEQSIQRSTTLATQPFTPFLSVKFITILQSRSILIVASSYRIVSFRLTGQFDFEIYNCASSSCGEVVGLSSEDVTGQVHFSLQYSNGTLALFELNQEDRTPVALSTTNDLRETQQLLVIGDRVVFLNKNGSVGYCSRKLTAINMNYALSDITSILPIQATEESNKLAFADQIEMGDDTRDELTWGIDPLSQTTGRIFYKVSLYREKIGVGEKSIEITTENHLKLSSALLESWSSGQKFDVTIEAMSPWVTVSTQKIGLQAPVKPPSPPTNPRLFTTLQKTVDGPRAIISFFWEEPQKWNGNRFQYHVNCSKDDGTNQESILPSADTHFSFAVKNGKVSCKVAASNEPNNIGAYTDEIAIDSSALKPLVRLFAIDSTYALIAITNITEQDASRRKRQTHQMEYQAIAFIGNDLYAVRKEPDTLQPFLVQIDANDIEIVVHKVSLGGDVTKVEAMTSDWVGNRLLMVSGTALYQLTLDPFRSSSVLTPKKLMALSAGAADAKQLTFDPFKNTAYLLTRNGSLFALDLTRSIDENLALTVSCTTNQTITWMMTEFLWNGAFSPKIYALTWNALIVIDVKENYTCSEVRIDRQNFGDKGLKSMTAFAVADKLFVFANSSVIFIYGTKIQPIPIKNPPLRQILAVSQSSQPFPERSCFALPSSSKIKFNVSNEGKTGAFIDVERPPPSTICSGISFPQTRYEVYFTRKGTDKSKHIRSYTDHIHIENGILDKETDYEVTVAWNNYYTDEDGISPAYQFRTGYGYPSAPRSVAVFPLTPDTVHLHWNLPETLNAPIADIRYKITQQASALSSPTSIVLQELLSNGTFSNSTSDFATCLVNPCRVRITNLRPSTEYKFWITAVHISHLNAQFLEDAEAVSQEASARTKDVPGTMRPENVTGSSLLLRWNTLEAEMAPSNVSVQYRESSTTEWKAPLNATFNATVPTVLVLINNLQSATTYDYRFVATYTGTFVVESRSVPYREDYFQGVQQAKTKAGVPTAPENVNRSMDPDGWIIKWHEPTSDGGSVITSYAVEMRVNKSAEWEIAERGLDAWKMWWRPAKSNKDDSAYQYRVRAANQEGFGAYGYMIEQPEIRDIEKSSNVIYFIIGALLFVLCILLCLLFLYLRARRQALIRAMEHQTDKNCISLEKMTGLTQGPDQGISKEMLNELKNLPMINRSTLRLNKQIGTGSFGAVHEGTASELPFLSEEEVAVAVKELKPNCGDDLRMKFLKELILMNNLDHPNIVKLLGVCTSITPHYMVLEFMGGGDLLEFLKKSAPTDTTPSQLYLRQLLGLALDVARGAAYLEANDYVHRDLAARNCLITFSRNIPVVKIADFGVARGVYNTDYHLQAKHDTVRWMAPEAASEGKFTSKSDVWSFGVVLYEIITLGARPFANINDNQVILEHILKGGTLAKPLYCPEQFYKVMSRCWALQPETRPAFADLLPLLEGFREKSEFQEEKPFPPYGCGHANEAFESSHDSSSSERIETARGEAPVSAARSFAGFERAVDSNFASSACLLPGRSSRSLRKDSAPAPLPSQEEIEARLRYSADDGPNYDCLPSPTSFGYSSPYRTNTFQMPSTSYEVPNTPRSHPPDPYHEETQQRSLSRSWGGSKPLQPQGDGWPSTSSSNSPSQRLPPQIRPDRSFGPPPPGAGNVVVAPRGNRNAQQPNYDMHRRSRVSQV